jgi:thiol-disulfide isomerase/thioredoxin
MPNPGAASLQAALLGHLLNRLLPHRLPHLLALGAAARRWPFSFSLPFQWQILPALFWAGLIGVSGSAHAQFEKTPWPRTQATPALNVVDLQGQRWTAAELSGQVVVLNFWATWCAPCVEEMPSLQALHNNSERAPKVLAVNVKETASTVRRFMAAQRIDMPVVLDPQGDLTRQWGVRVYPTTVLIGPDGRARWRVVGEVDWQGAEARGWLRELQRTEKEGSVKSPNRSAN